MPSVTPELRYDSNENNTFSWTCHICQGLYGTPPSYPDYFPKECSRILDLREQQLSHRMPRVLEGTWIGSGGEQPDEAGQGCCQRVQSPCSAQRWEAAVGRQRREPIAAEFLPWSWASPRLAAEGPAGYSLAGPRSKIQIHRSLFFPKELQGRRSTHPAALEFRTHLLPTTVRDTAIPVSAGMPRSSCQAPVTLIYPVPTVLHGAAENWIKLPHLGPGYLHQTGGMVRAGGSDSTE